LLNVLCLEGKNGNQGSVFLDVLPPVPLWLASTSVRGQAGVALWGLTNRRRQKLRDPIETSGSQFRASGCDNGKPLERPQQSTQLLALSSTSGPGTALLQWRAAGNGMSEE
jgi:hypothetical protein